ncbi:MAG TPA: S8 family peptidase [Bryobacteraceae bacterium]|nr:S8 family peptidase [Bryobacteraceae bacterium]
MISRFRLLIALIVAPALLLAQTSKVSPDMPKSGSVSVVIQYKTAPSVFSGLNILGLGGLLNQLLSSLNALVAIIDAGTVGRIAADPNVLYISPDRALSGMLEYANPTVGANIALQHGFDGSGIGIALIDSGVTVNANLSAQTLLGQLGLRSRVVYNQSFVNGQNAQDGYGHGTYVAGILAGDRGLSTGRQYTHTFRGIAPNAQIVNLRVLDANGNGSDSAVIAAIEQAVALKSRYNIRVINLSLGRPVFESYQQDPLCRAVEYAWKNGITVVVAAGNFGRPNESGNNGYGTILSPANDPSVITVGAMKDEQTVSRGDDPIASYSSKGPAALDHIVKPDIVAPGNHIISIAQPSSTLYKEARTAGVLVPLSYYSSGTGYSTQYFALNGTSMAAPTVSAAVALLVQQDASLTPDQVKARLMLTASKELSLRQRGDRSGERGGFHQLLRHFHRRRGLSGCLGGAERYAPSHGQRGFADGGDGCRRRRSSGGYERALLHGTKDRLGFFQRLELDDCLGIERFGFGLSFD